MSWTWIGPLSIWYYEEHLLKNFYRESRYIIQQNCWNEINSKISKYYKRALITAWTLVVIVIYLCVARSYCNKHLGFHGFTDPWYLLSVVSVGMQAVLSGIGFYGCINSMSLIWNVYKSCDLIINPYHFDNKAGMSIFSNLSSKTTLIFSTGAIYLPILLTVATSINEILVVGIYFLTTIFSVSIFLSYSISNYLLYRKSRLIVSKEAQKIAAKLNPLYNRIVNESMHADNIIAEYNNLRRAFHDLISIELYPFNLKGITFMASVIIVPFLMVLAQMFLPIWLGIRIQ
jgi:hypothetical protein